MKNLTKIFMAVCVALFAFACATDPTEDLGSNVGAGGQTKLTFSLEGTKTHLGELSGEQYPLYWSEGDVISVNGISSTSIAISNNASVAEFTFDGNLGDTYKVVYPAANAGEVVFAAEQNYVAGTFDNGAAAMYGYGVGDLGLKLKHLTGVLKIGVIGENTSITHAQISTVNRAPIAGAFKIDFESGEVTPTESATEVIEYNFDKPVALSSTPTYLHIAVPAGIYEELYVTLYDSNGGVMYATVQATNDNPETTNKVERPLSAGVVRKFSSDLLYSANSQAFIIDSEDKLFAFAAEVKNGGFTKDVVLVKDIVMTKDWTTISSWDSTNGNKCATIHGNGYSIKGLTAPLFGVLYANVKGLHLEDVEIVSNDKKYDNRWVVGALACECKSPTAFATKFENCSVSGSITVSNPNSDIGNAVSNVSCGGFFGRAAGIVLDKCVNRATITVQKIAKTATTKNQIYNNIGGIVGYCNKNGDRKILISNCVNRGSIIHNDESKIVGIRSAIGGIVGMVYQKENLTELVNNKNYGSISFQSSAEDETSVGGIVGNAHTENGSAPTDSQRCIFLDGCTNSGSITVSGSVESKTYVGGILGFTQFRTLQDCHNYGAVELTAESTIKQLYIGGVAGVVQGDMEGCNGYSVTGCSNNAAVTVNSQTHSSGTNFRIGGVVGYSRAAKLEECHNNVGGAVSFGGACKQTLYMGGVFAHSASAKVSDVTNSGTISCGGTSNENLFIGGVIGHSEGADVDELTNSGAVSFTGTNAVDSSSDAVYELCLGGVIGNSTGADVYDLTNSGAISWGATNTIANKATAYLNISGVLGRSAGVAVEDLNNNGSLSLASTTSTNGAKVFIGGALGRSYSEITDATSAPYFKNITNTGKVTIEGAMAGQPSIGGAVGHIDSKDTADTSYLIATLENVTNSGDVLADMNYTTNSNIYIVGAVGRTWGSATGVTNSGKVSFTGKSTKNNTNVMGCIGYGKAVSNLTNSGIVSCSSQNIKTLRIAGCAGYPSSTTNATNTGKVSYSGKATANVSISGVVQSGGAISNCHNSGTLEFDGEIATSSSLFMSGVATEYTSMSGVTNTGTLHCKKTLADVSKAYVGGIVAKETVAISNARSYCELIMLGYTREKGANFGLFTGTSYTENTNSTNCHIGGKIATEKDGQGAYSWVEIDDFTYVEYIYGTMIEPAEAFANKLGWLKDDINSDPVGLDLVPIE